ncbi:type i dna methyltransferase m subunit [Lasius niger]|uniref:Type i dna methyltransferase m subunit n=1 Tax=Lasius niger TaxID=67767 RepID=A0A0J7JYF8_LASNI|nr:type i dna methyltransferase m subunit [Lasius niger]
MEAVERDNITLKGVLPSGYADPSLDQSMIGGLVEQFTNDIKPQKKGQSTRDLLGQVYEYFLGEFAGKEGKRGGEFYTPRCVVQLLVEMLSPEKGERIYDPCCGSGGMFIQSEKFIEAHGGAIGDIAIYGQESNQTTFKLAKMNLGVRGISANIKWNNGGSFLKDELPDERFEVILANPPFNVSDWWDAALKGDVRWQYGQPPQGNANFGWMSHILHHLTPDGRAGVVLANGSMSSGQRDEAAIRKNMIEQHVVDCIVALPGQMFFTTQIPACLWFLNKEKNPKTLRNRESEILFIDARKMGKMVSRTRRELTEDDISKISKTYHAWQGIEEAGKYQNIAGFCYAATLDEVAQNEFIVTPGRYVGVAESEEDTEPFLEKFSRLQTALLASLEESARLDKTIKENLGQIILPEKTEVKK